MNSYPWPLLLIFAQKRCENEFRSWHPIVTSCTKLHQYNELNVSRAHEIPKNKKCIREYATVSCCLFPFFFFIPSLPSFIFFTCFFPSKRSCLINSFSMGIGNLNILVIEKLFLILSMRQISMLSVCIHRQLCHL